MATLLALVAATSWGASDFLGGLAGRRSVGESTIAISFTAQIIGFVGLAILASATPGTLTGRDVAIGLLAGVGGGIGIALLYRGLRIGRMGVVAPITGVGAAAIPVIYSAVSGEHPTTLAWFGVAVSLAAIVLVSREPDRASRTVPAMVPASTSGTAPGPDAVSGAGPDLTAAHPRWQVGPPGLLEAIGGGIGFGIIFVMLDQTSPGSGLWPLVPMKMSAALLFLLVGLVARKPLLPERAALAPVIGVGVLDNLANVVYLLATRSGLLALVAVISSLYPVITVLLARGVLDEQLQRIQIGGLVLAGVGVTLIAVA